MNYFRQRKIHIPVMHFKSQNMKRTLFFTLLLLISVMSFAQESKFSLELNSPFYIDTNYSRDQSRTMDIGLKYGLLDYNFVKVGASVNSLMVLPRDASRMKYSSITLSPRIYAEFKIKSLPKLHPLIGVGYSLERYKLGRELQHFTEDGSLESLGTHFSAHGLNLNFGAEYDITSKFFIKGQYDFMRMTNTNEELKKYGPANSKILKLGIGYRF